MTTLPVHYAPKTKDSMNVVSVCRQVIRTEFGTGIVYDKTAVTCPGCLHVLKVRAKKRSRK